MPDERKGERLIVVHTPLDKVARRKSADQLPRDGLPNLWIPAPTASWKSNAIPVLGSGKTDLKALSEIAKRHFGEAA